MRTLQTYLPLSGEVTVTGGDTEDETVELWEFVGGDDRVVGLGGGVQGSEDLRRERLGDSIDGRCIRNDVLDRMRNSGRDHSLVDGSRTSVGFDTSLDGLSHYSMMFRMNPPIRGKRYSHLAMWPYME